MVMEHLPVDSIRSITQYNGLVFPGDNDVIFSSHNIELCGKDNGLYHTYHKLMMWAIGYNRPGWVRVLLEQQRRFGPYYIIGTAAMGHSECPSYPASGIARITHRRCVI